jgi:IclR family transcriptional regulator, KDG regulon repressor
MSDQLSTVVKTLRVLEAFSYAQPVLGVSELARKLGMGKSSVHRALSTLHEHGYVVKTPDDRYRLGLKLHEMGQLVISGLRLHEVAHDALDRLRHDTKESVHLAVLDGNDVVYIDRMEAAEQMRMFSKVGRRMPVHATSSGKCLLAFGSDETRDAVMKAMTFERRAPRTITSASMFRTVLAGVSHDGYAVSVEESEKGVASVGAPVFGRDGSCIAAVSLVGSVVRLTEDSIPKYVRLVRKCSLEISEAMGYNAKVARG